MDDNDKLSALPPNGVMIFLDRESGDWVLSANRFTVKTVTTDVRDKMLVEAVEMTGLDEYQILPQLPEIGEVIGCAESHNKKLASLEEGTQLVPTLWGWLVGWEDKFPLECDNENCDEN